MVDVDSTKDTEISTEVRQRTTHKGILDPVGRAQSWRMRRSVDRHLAGKQKWWSSIRQTPDLGDEE